LNRKDKNMRRDLNIISSEPIRTLPKTILLLLATILPVLLSIGFAILAVIGKDWLGAMMFVFIAWWYLFGYSGLCPFPL